MWADLKYAVRMLLKAPGFTAVALLTLALGIGANTAIFSLVDAVMLRQLPVSDPGQLALLTDPAAMGMSMGTSGGRRGLLTYDEFLRLRDQNQVFTGLSAAESDSQKPDVDWSAAGQTSAPEPANIQLVSNNFFSVLGVSAYRGRTFAANEGQKIGADPVAVMRYGYWKSRFQMDPGIIGRSFSLHGHNFTVIGVTPPTFFGETVGLEPDLWLPITMQPQAVPGRDRLHDPPGTTRMMWLQVMGRLKPGVSLQQAQTASNLLFHQAIADQAGAASDPQQKQQLMQQRLELTPGGMGSSGLRDQFASPLIALFALVGLVLLLAVVNLASLLLARAAARQKEIGVRLALGAGRGRILKQLLTESILLSLIGGLLGALLAVWGVRILMSMVVGANSDIALPLTPDWRVLGFVALLCMASGLLFGLAPAWRMARLNLNATLQAQGRAVHTRMPLTKALVIGQVALSVILLLGAGLFLHSLTKLQAQPLGFNHQGLYISGLSPAQAGFKDEAATAFWHRFLDSAAATPGVQHVALSMTGLFLGDDAGLPIAVDGYTPKSRDDAGANVDMVSADYFQTVGIPILMGRGFNPGDATSGPRNAVINQTMAKQFFAGRSPIGGQIRDLYPDDHNTVYTVVGVCGDSKTNSLQEKIEPRFYLSFFHGVPVAGAMTSAAVLVRESGSGSANNSLRQMTQSLSPGLRVQPYRPVADMVARSLVGEKLTAKLSGFFGALGLLLAAIGIYGVLAYSVARRTAEIGVRVALGASRGAVVSMVLREAGWLLLIGLAVGIPAALALGKVTVSQLHLFQMNYYDPAALALAVGALTAVALLAGFLPARRASQIDPLLALREE
ncbi:MAG: ABC transporter permease [Terriglobales bacterium]